MKAAVCREFGKPLHIEEVGLDSPRRGEVRVRVRACGICQSDIHYIAGAWGGPLPAVFGHEVAGTVEAAGDDVEGLQPGQSVVVSLIRACGRCPFCTRGQPALCARTFDRDASPPIRDTEAKPIYQGLATGGFAESTVVDASQVVPVPAQLPAESACLLACCVITGFGAVVNTAGVEPGNSVVVIGTGGVGLNAVQAAAIAGADPVVALDVSPAKLPIARSFGATHAFDSRDDAAKQTLRELTGGRLADVVVVAAGSGAAVEQGLRLVGRGGTVVIVGMPESSAVSQLAVTAFAYQGQRVLGSKMGGARPRIDVPRLAALYDQGRLRLDELVSGRYRLDQINDAIASSNQGQAVRNVIVFPE